MNLAKFLALRERHERLHADFRRTTEAARTALAAVAQVRAEILIDPGNDDAAAIVDLPAAELSQVDAERIERAGIDPRSVRRLIAAHAHAALLRGEADALAQRLAQSRPLMAALETYTQAHSHEI